MELVPQTLRKCSSWLVFGRHPETHLFSAECWIAASADTPTLHPPPLPPHLTFSISTALFCCVSVWKRHCDVSMKLVPGCWALYKSTVIINYFRNCYNVYAQCCFKSIFLNQNKCHQNSSHPAVTWKFAVTFNAFPKPRQMGGGGGGGGGGSQLKNV